MLEITILMFHIELETQPELGSEMVLLGSVLIREVYVRIRVTACEQNGVRSWILPTFQKAIAECLWAPCDSARWLCLRSSMSVLDHTLLLFTRCSLRCWNELASLFVWSGLCEKAYSYQ